MAASRDRLETMAAQRSAVLVGHDSLQNRLLAELISERVGCGVELRPPQSTGSLPAPAGAVALLDVGGMPRQDIDRHVRMLVASGPYAGIALLNVQASEVMEIVDSPGVQGVFFCETSKENLIKGIQALFAGEYWLPREVLSEHFARSRRAHRPGALHAGLVELTRKETETLELLLDGHSNSVIARRLGVSVHTVKTHLYNLFRKIGARNRVQAVNWAMQSIERPERELE